MKIYKDTIVGLVAILIGLFFAVSSRSIESFSDDPAGPQFFPIAVSILIIVFGIVLAIKPATKYSNKNEEKYHIEFIKSIRSPIVPLTAAGLAYPLLFQLFGYVISTLIILPFALFVFGHRSILSLISISITTTIIYYIIFFRLLGLFEPSGLFFNS